MDLVGPRTAPRVIPSLRGRSATNSRRRLLSECVRRERVRDYYTGVTRNVQGKNPVFQRRKCNFQPPDKTASGGPVGRPERWPQVPPSCRGCVPPPTFPL